MKIQRDQPNKRQQHLPRLCVVDVAVMLCATIGLAVVLATTHLVPVAYIIIQVVACLGITAIVFFLTKDHKKRKLRVAGTVIAVILLIVAVVAGYYITQTVNAVRRVADASVERSQVTFYAMQDNEAETLDDLANGMFGILQELDRANTDATLQQVEAEHGLTLNTIEYGSLIQLADALQDGEVDAIVLNEAYLTLYEETPGYEDFPAQLKTISTQQVEHVVEAEPEPEQSSADPMINILISGSHTR